MKDRLLKIIKDEKLTINSFSERIGVDESTIRKATTHDSAIRTDTLLKISGCFPNINIDWLVTGRGSMYYKFDEKTALLQASESQIVEILLKKNEDLIRANQLLEQQVDELSKKVAQLKSESMSMEHSTL